MNGAWAEGSLRLPEGFVPPLASLSPPAPATLEQILTGWERIKPPRWYVLCRPDDHDRIKALCAQLPEVGLVVIRNVIVPIGQIYVIREPKELTAAPLPFWLCPNTPRCGHAALLHDIEDLEDPAPRCCVEGCSCGQLSSRG